MANSSKGYLFLIVFLLCQVSVLAITSANLTSYYSFDSDATDSHSSNDGTVTGATLDTTTKKLGAGSYSFDGAADYIAINGVVSDVSFRTEGAVCYWARPTTNSEPGVTIGFTKGTASNDGVLLQGASDSFWAYDNDGNVYLIDNPTDYSKAGIWAFFCYTHDGTRTYMYQNGTLSSNTNNVTTNTAFFWDDIQSFTYATIGAARWSGIYNYEYDGRIDEVSIWNKNLSATEISDLFALGVGCDYSCISSTTTAGLNINASNRFNSQPLLVFNATISNSTFSSTIESNFSTGISFFENVTNGNYTVNVSNSQFFNLSYTIELLEVNASVQSNLTQAYLLTEAFLTNGTRINYFNTTLGGQTNETTNGTGYLIAAGGSHTLSFNSAGYLSEGYSVTYSNLSYNYFRFNVSEIELNVTAAALGGGSITNFIVNVTRLNGDYIFSEVNSTTTSSARFGITAGQYNISIIADGYAFDNVVITFNSSPQYFQYNFTLPQTNTFNISFYDEVDKTILDSVTTTLELISDTFSGNYSTTNGTLEINLLTPEGYVLRYSATPDYPQRFNYIVLQNGTFNNLAFYLLNTSDSTDVTATVYDENNLVVEGVQIKSLRYDITTNSYILQEIVSTNFEGKATMGLQLDTEYYIFILLYNDKVKLQTTPSYVTATSLTFGIVLTSVAGEQFFIYEDITSNIYYNNNTNNFVFTYDDSSNTATQGCMEVYRVDTTTPSLVNSSCTSTASASIVLGITPTNNTKYRADGYITIDGTKTYIKSAFADFTTDEPLKTQEGSMLIWALTILFMLVGIYSLSVSLLLTPLPVVMGSILGILNVPVWASMGIYVLALILAAIISKRN